MGFHLRIPRLEYQMDEEVGWLSQISAKNNDKIVLEVKFTKNFWIYKYNTCLRKALERFSREIVEGDGFFFLFVF